MANENKPALLMWHLTTVNNGNRIALLKDEGKQLLARAFIEDQDIVIEQCVYESNTVTIPIFVANYLMHGVKPIDND